LKALYTIPFVMMDTVVKSSGPLSSMGEGLGVRASPPLQRSHRIKF